MKNAYPEEKGKIAINGRQMEWVLRRSKGESCFGIQGSRIFALELKKNGETVLDYERGLKVRPGTDDEETKACLGYLIDKYGRVKKKEKDKEK